MFSVFPKALFPKYPNAQLPIDSILPSRGIVASLQQTRKAIEDGKRYGYELNENRYFFVEKFYETDYKKETKGAPMGPRMFDLTEKLHRDTLPEETAEIADLLRKETWE